MDRSGSSYPRKPHPSGQKENQRANPQFLIHVLASIHPTYRATTNPMKFVPESWRDYQSSLNSNTPGISDSVIPDVGQPFGQLPDFESLRNNSALDGRRKANAVFVVLGQSNSLVLLMMLIRSEKLGSLAILGIDEADGRSIQPLGALRLCLLERRGE
jgi:hypothetical protein